MNCRYSKQALLTLSVILLASIGVGCGGSGGGGGNVSRTPLVANTTVSGMVYQADGKTPVGEGYTVNLASSFATTMANGGGSYTISVPVPDQSQGAKVTLTVLDPNGNYVGGATTTVKDQAVVGVNIILPSVGGPPPVVILPSEIGKSTHSHQ